MYGLSRLDLIALLTFIPLFLFTWIWRKYAYTHFMYYECQFVVGQIVLLASLVLSFKGRKKFTVVIGLILSVYSWIPFIERYYTYTLWGIFGYQP
jgi:hypothetical protein